MLFSSHIASLLVASRTLIGRMMCHSYGLSSCRHHLYQRQQLAFINTTVLLPQHNIRINWHWTAKIIKLQEVVIFDDTEWHPRSFAPSLFQVRFFLGLHICSATVGKISTDIARHAVLVDIAVLLLFLDVIVLQQSQLDLLRMRFSTEYCDSFCDDYWKGCSMVVSQKTWRKMQIARKRKWHNKWNFKRFLRRKKSWKAERQR